MRRTIITIMLAVAVLFTATPVNANTTDLNNAKAWAHDHYSQHNVKVVDRGQVGNDNGTIYIERVKTKATSKTKGKVIGTRYAVKYPKKVKKGKKITVYMVYDEDFEITAMVCLGKVKADKGTQIDCPNCTGSDRDCVYWLHDEGRHMTEEEIAEFEYWECHYTDESGNVVER